MWQTCSREKMRRIRESDNGELPGWEAQASGPSGLSMVHPRSSATCYQRFLSAIARFSAFELSPSSVKEASPDAGVRGGEVSDPPVFVPSHVTQALRRCSTPLDTGAACAGGGVAHFFIDPCGKANCEDGEGRIPVCRERMRRMGEDNGNLRWEAKQAAPDACRWSPRRRDLLPTVPIRSPASAPASPRRPGIEPRELDRCAETRVTSTRVGPAEFADHKTDCARLD